MMPPVLSGAPASTPATGSGSDKLTRADLQALLKLLKESQSGAAVRPTATYAQSYENGKRQRLHLDSSSAATPPPFPAAYIGRVNEDENAELLPKVLKLLANLPGAEVKKAASSGRDAVVYNGVMIVDTRRLCYLGGHAPDLTVLLDGYNVAGCVALALLELQVGAIDNAHKGKMESCLLSLLNACPDRHMAKGVVFNGADVVLFKATRTQGEVQLHESLELNMGGGSEGARRAWTHLWTFLLSGVGARGSGAGPHVCEHYGWAPPVLYAEFGSSTLSSLRRLLLNRFIASSGNVNVWEVDLSVREVAVCKHYTGGQRTAIFKRDLAALLAIKDAIKDGALQADGQALWPQLVAFNEDQRVLITKPLAKPPGLMTAATLHELLAGYKFLHTVVRYVHRDLEDKHVGQAEDGRLCVFDLSTCVPLETGSGAASTSYAGTVVNASEDVLEALRWDELVEVPVRAQQDLVALVKTVYALNYPARLTHIQRLAIQVAHSLSSVAAGAGAAGAAAACTPASSVVDQVRSFWRKEFSISTPAGRVWRALVQLAHVDTPAIAAEVWGGAPIALPYSEVVKQLEEQLGELVCPC